MERPLGVTILAGISFFAAGVTVLVALFALFGAAIVASIASLPGAIAGAGALVGGLVCCLFVALYSVNGIGLLRLRNWARLLTIVLVAFSLLSAAGRGLSSLAHFRIFSLLICAIVVGIDLWVLTYLFKPHVKQAFGATGV